MKTIGIIAVLLFSSTVLADSECPLFGTFKSDATKTLEDYSAHNSIDSPEVDRALTEMFGSVTHEWRCNELRAWHGDYPTQWDKISVSQLGKNSLVVTFPDGKNPDLTLEFEGPCYKVRFAERNYLEYYCPQMSNAPNESLNKDASDVGTG